MAELTGYSIDRMLNDAEARSCARMMAASEPWLTLGRSYEACLAIITLPGREVYVLRGGAEVAGFIIISMVGPLVGYIQTVCIDSEKRGLGLGSRLVEFAEQRILAESPNVFMCVSSFNQNARRLYQRLGYQVVGELTDYIVRGHSEILLRKTTGPLTGFSGKAPPPGSSMPPAGMAPSPREK
jgi:[ribosomal protein S18]-alanine N-acetyltransferase